MACTVVLITGCSSGIGLHLAVRLASDPSQSFKVYATMRDLKTQGQLWEAARAQGCPRDSLETLQLDVRDSKSVANAQACVTEGRVDILVCNAGQGLLGPLEALGEDAVGSVLDVNVAGTVRMLQAFLPEMKRRGSGRVLVTGSMGGLMGLPFNDVYCASKFALEGLCESLAVLLPPFGVHVSLIECGPVHTPFMQKVLGGPGWMLDRTDTRTRRLFHQYLQHNKEIFREAAQHPEEVVEVFLTALRAPKPALRYFTTERFLPLQQMRLDDPSGSSYVAAMHRNVFPKEPAEAEAGAGAGGVGDPELGDTLAAPQ
ncbi:estradiol 17-beta-dehydrogenase 1 [Callithrix jacchus]|uniref:Estradiol 17-beta-dehydrogenase n=1 Tax=Callithrix jacchus TaxID=9483 RepID=Q9GME2_CALJA|nr:estradiol 17-beta-dehydrogenase 1 [Callithrix jacchus]AAG01115.3 17-beta-hydroxysteroid dehydrogenase type 1 [Callithrix jacchus]